MKAADNNALFWVTMVGGPPLYEEKHGKPMMRQRHFRFEITGEARATWLACWEPVLAEAPRTLGFPAEHIEGFRAWITTFSAWIVNTKSPADEAAEAEGRSGDEAEAPPASLRFKPASALGRKKLGTLR
jgi:truncated hemoglobin YjbI